MKDATLRLTLNTVIINVLTAEVRLGAKITTSCPLTRHICSITHFAKDARWRAALYVILVIDVDTDRDGEDGSWAQDDTQAQ